MNLIKKKSVSTINILILASGKSFTSSKNRVYPQCLTEIRGLSLLERIIKNTNNISNGIYAFTFLESEAIQFHLHKIATLLVPGASTTQVPELSQGSACSALLAACKFNQEAELIIISANELVDVDLSEIIAEFRSRELDGGTLTFQSIHPRYSYVRLNEKGFVTEAAQCEPISLYATAGIFWFAKTSYFVNGAKNIIRKNANINGNYFIAPTFNEMVLLQKKIGVIELDDSKYFPLKNEQQVEQFQGINYL